MPPQPVARGIAGRPLDRLPGWFCCGDGALAPRWCRGRACHARCGPGRRRVSARQSDRAGRGTGASGRAALRAKAQAEIAARDFDHGVELARGDNASRGLLWMGEALREAPAENPQFARLVRANIAAWENQLHAVHAILEHHGAVHHAVFRGDSGAVFTGGGDGIAKLWDVATGHPLGPPLSHSAKVYTVAFAPKGRLLFTGSYDGRVRQWDAATGMPAGPTLTHGEPVWAMMFAGGGRILVTQGRDLAAQLWSLDGRAVAPPLEVGNVNSFDVSPDGRVLLTYGADKLVRFWDVPSTQAVGTPLQHESGVVCGSFSPDGRLIVTGCSDGTNWLWDAATHRRIRSLPRHQATVWRATFSPDSKSILTTSADKTANLSNAATGQLVGRALRHSGEIKSGGFSSDGRFVITGSLDGTARLWDSATAHTLGAALEHRLGLNAVAISADSKLVLTAGEDGLAKLWEVSSCELGPKPGVAISEEKRTTSLASLRARGFSSADFSPDRSRALFSGIGRSMLIDTATGQPLGASLDNLWPSVRTVAFSPDGRRVATSSRDNPIGQKGSTRTHCQIWDTTTGRALSPLLPHLNWVAALAFRPDGNVLATGDYTSGVHLWDVRTGAEIGRPLYAGSIVTSLCFSPNGRVLAAGTAETAHHVVLWDSANGQLRSRPVPFRRIVHHLAFSADGRRLAAGSDDSTAQLIDVSTGGVIGEPLQHTELVSGLAFGPDSRQLLTVEPRAQSAARLWDTETGKPISPIMAHPGPVGRLER